MSRPALALSLSLSCALLGTGCTLEGTSRFPAPILEPAGPARVVAVHDRDSESLLDKPPGTLTSRAWPTHVDASKVCFDVEIRLWRGAGTEGVSRESWAFWVESSAGETPHVMANRTWEVTRSADHFEGRGDLCFPNRGISRSDVVELHAEYKALELLFRWISDREPLTDDELDEAQRAEE